MNKKTKYNFQQHSKMALKSSPSRLSFSVLMLLLSCLESTTAINRKFSILEQQPNQETQPDNNDHETQKTNDEHRQVGGHAHAHFQVEPSHHDPAHPNKMDPSHYVFLAEPDLHAGETRPVFFANAKPFSSSSSPFLPKKQADSIPFTLSQLPQLLQLFSLSNTSSMARSMGLTLQHCESPPVKGESKTCATSLDSMLHFVRSIFGARTRFRALTTSFIGQRRVDPPVLLQNYTILEVVREEPLAREMIACHGMPYPYAVYYCHHLNGGSKVFSVEVVGDNGERVGATVGCHMDTSGWNSDHVAFHMLGVERGSSPVCHFFEVNSVVWVPVSDVNAY
ncbi:hypothetical protein Scep_000752 [Stephania cephalantha]|uniref:BURP domain-containing protein n=1 Tax=Stephania cephalantha TaxID=152367 RepID=A0AAP0L6W3_9MAGN